MTKKELKKRAEIAAIKKRLRDICLGAYGAYALPSIETTDEEFFGVAYAIGMDAFARFVGAVKNAFLLEDDDYRVRVGFLDRYDNLDKAAEWLWETGIRA